MIKLLQRTAAQGADLLGIRGLPHGHVTERQSHQDLLHLKLGCPALSNAHFTAADHLMGP